MRPPPPIKKGDELTLGWLNGIREWVIRNTITLGVNSGLAMTQSPNGTALRVQNMGGEGPFLCVTNGTITAATAFSGSTATAGSGSVFKCTTSGTATITKTTVTLDVLNFSTTTGGIASGVNVWVAQEDSGYFYIISVDCGN